MWCSHSVHSKGRDARLLLASKKCAFSTPTFFCYLVAKERLINFFSVVFSGEAVRLRDGGESVIPLARAGFLPRVGFWSCLLGLLIFSWLYSL